MKCTEVFERIEVYHAGELPRLEAEALEQHLLSCADCAREFRFLRSLRAEAAALPREIAPPLDLWPGIVDHMGRGPVTAKNGSSRWLRPPMLAAAAVVLMLGTAAVTAGLLRRDNPTLAQATGADFRVTEAAYQHAATELSATLEVRRKNLSPAANMVIEQNLRIIDEAIREIQAALAADPNNQDVRGLLWGSYEKKIDLLQRAAESVES